MTVLSASSRGIAGPGDDDDDDDEAPVGDPPDDDDDEDVDEDDDDDDDEEPLQVAFLHCSIAIGARARHNVAPIGTVVRPASRFCYLIPDF